MPVADLENLSWQFHLIESEARSLLTGLTEIQLNWQPGRQRWSIAQCIDHLLVTGNNSLSNLHQAIDEARSKGLFSQGPFRYGMIERWFVNQMEPRSRMRFKAPRVYAPSVDPINIEIVTRFYKLQGDFLSGIERADGLDLARTKVNNPVTKWLRLSLGQEFAFNAAHERRHLWQAQLIMQSDGFPR